MMIGFRQESSQVLTVTYQPMLCNFDQEPLKSLLPLDNLLRLIVVPVDQRVLGRNGWNNARWEAALENLRQPLKVLVSPIHIVSRLFPCG